MLTAKTSHSSGLRKFGHIPIWFGIGNMQYATQTRPTWMPGKISAHMTAKIVIASAERLIDVRHFWRNRKRIAEISVPAWPMPTQKTKFVMSQAQPTGTFSPQMPIPSQNSQETGDAQEAREAPGTEEEEPPREAASSLRRAGDGFGDRDGNRAHPG